MDPTYQKNQSQNHKRLIIIIASISAFLLFAGGAIFVLDQLNHQRLVNEVTTELNKVPNIMEKSKTSSGVYPSSIPTSLLPSSTKVSLVGQGSYDGMSYCVTGTSKSNKLIVYHVDSTSSTPTAKACAKPANLPTPDVPTSLLLGSTGPDQLNVTWLAAPKASSYVVECSPNADFRAPIIDKPTTATDGVCEGLQPSTLYYVRVKSANSSKGSNWSGVITAKTSEMSVAPTGYSGNGLSVSSISYSWKAVDGAESYVVEMASDVNFMKDVQTQTVSPSKSSVIFSGLQPGTAYFVHVKAVTADFDASHAAFSGEMQVKTLAK